MGELKFRPLGESSSRRWLLSLAGGGYRGLFTARFLERLEAALGGPCAGAFDIIAGTSIGSIAAIALARRIQAAQIVAFFERHGPAIFPARSGLAGLRMLVRPKYTTDALRAALRETFGSGGFADLHTRVVVPAVSLADSSAAVFRTHNGRFAASDLSLVDAALASAAAPVFFPPHSIGTRQYVDGGLIANAPDHLVTVEATAGLGWDSGDLTLLSVGTTAAASGLAYSTGDLRWSAAGWVWRKKLVDQMMAAQADLSHRLARDVLGDRYLHVDVQRGPEQDAIVGLDRVTPEATATLKALADAAWDRFSNGNRVVIDRLARRVAGQV